MWFKGLKLFGVVSITDGADSNPVIKASQEKKDTPLTELIMKDPASDFLLKQQPLEYYKCHLHAVLGKREEGDLRCAGVQWHSLGEAETCGLNGMSCYLGQWMTEAWDMSDYKAGWDTLTVLDSEMWHIITLP